MENREDGEKKVEEVTVETVEDEGDEERPSKKAKVSDAADDNSVAAPKVDEPHCLVCMETSSEESSLQKHQCGQCSPDGWLVCDSCNSALLSRTCPVCRGDYAPIVMYAMPGLPLKKLADPSLSSNERAELLYKFGVVRQLISKVNVAVWSPSTNKMHFTLPKSSTEVMEDVSIVIVSIPFDQARLLDQDKFHFTNHTWDEIENVIEAGEVQAGEEVDLARATQWILSFTKEDNHILFTMMTPADWSFTLNPDAPDVNEAVKMIRDGILGNIQIPNRSVTNSTEDKQPTQNTNTEDSEPKNDT